MARMKSLPAVTDSLSKKAPKEEGNRIWEGEGRVASTEGEKKDIRPTMKLFWDYILFWLKTQLMFCQLLIKDIHIFVE